MTTVLSGILLTGCTLSTENGLVLNTSEVEAEDFASEVNDGMEELIGEDFAKRLVQELNDMLDEDTSQNINSTVSEEWY